MNIEYSNPALALFLKTLPCEFIWAQVLIRKEPSGFELRHVDDRNSPREQLKPISPRDLRHLASRNSRGEFRPLKPAPDLPGGWTVHCRTKDELADALNQFYPNSIVDWHSARQPSPPVTHYREFTSRQTGMYRITQMLTDEQAAKVIRSGCHLHFCLKRRLWTVQGLPPDEAGSKSEIPCLEPCAILLERARKAMRIEQEEKRAVHHSTSHLETRS